MGNFKVRCINNNGMNYFTTGKVYDIINSTLIDDYGDSLFTGRIKSFKDLEEYSSAKWELVDEKEKDKENDMVSFKVKCVDTKGASCYTKDKIYEIVDGNLTGDKGEIIIYDIESLEDIKKYSRAKWELVDENIFTTNTIYTTNIIANEKVEDVVNQPSHYLSSSLECIQAMEMAFGIEVVYNFCICNAWKYLWRYRSKNGKQDVAKARWYIDKAKSYNHYEVQHINIENVLIEIEKEVE